VGNNELEMLIHVAKSNLYNCDN